MSRTELYKVCPNGDVVRFTELPNAWRHAPLAWGKLFEKYNGPLDFETDYRQWQVDRISAGAAGRDVNSDPVLKEYDHGGWIRSWRLQHSPQISESDWCVLLTTFDGCVVRREHFQHVIKCYREFDAQFPGHFAACATALEHLMREDARGYCVNATSVNSNPWRVRLKDPDEIERLSLAADEGDDAAALALEGRPYNIDKDTQLANRVSHWFFDPTRYETRTQKDKP